MPVYAAHLWSNDKTAILKKDSKQPVSLRWRNAVKISAIKSVTMC